MADEQDLSSVPTVYVNAVRLALSFSDLRLFLGEYVPTEGTMNVGGGPTIGPAKQVDRVCVVLSPDIVPAIIGGLQQAIKTYETTFGPLRKQPALPLQAPAVHGASATSPTPASDPQPEKK